MSRRPEQARGPLGEVPIRLSPGHLLPPEVRIEGISHVGKESNRIEEVARGLAPPREVLNVYDPGDDLGPYRDAAARIGPRRLAEASGVPVRTIRRFVRGSTPRPRVLAELRRRIEALAWEEMERVSPEGWRAVTGGSLDGVPGYEERAGVQGPSIVGRLDDYLRARRQWERFVAASTCPGCGEAFPDLLHDCPAHRPPVRPCACGCGEPLPLGSRAHRRYAGDACRKRAARARKRA
jgi:hypothetical protein